MRKPPEIVVMLAPAALVTALVVALGFVMQPDEGSTDKSEAPLASTAPTSAPTSDVTPQGDGSKGDTTSRPLPSAAKPSGNATTRAPKKLLTGPRQVLQPKPKFRTIEGAGFTVASFNILGDSHTVRGGNKAGGRWGSSQSRMGHTLAALDRQSVDVVGLQEFQAPQFNNMMGRAGGTWAAYPGMSAGHNGVENSIAWRKSVFTPVETHTLAIPYFGGRAKLMPYVLLEHNESGRQLWVANFHNPADTPSQGNNFRHRRAATGKQIALANQLGADDTPVFFTGDFNERAEYFCPITGNTDLAAANGGSTGSACSPPGGMLVDWVFGSDEVDFSGYRADFSGQIRAASDHPLVVTEATLPEQKVRIRR